MNKKEYRHYIRNEVTNVARFITFGCYKRKCLLYSSESKRIFLEYLDYWRNRNNVEIWSYVIMPNHVHLLLYAAESTTLRKKLAVLKAQSGIKLISYLKKINYKDIDDLNVIDHGKIFHRFWQSGGGYDLALWEEDKIIKQIMYIHNNPVKKGLAEDIFDYYWSSANAWYHNSSDPIAINPTSFIR